LNEGGSTTPLSESPPLVCIVGKRKSRPSTETLKMKKVFFTGGSERKKKFKKETKRRK